MAWTVSCNDPSPINRMHLRFGSISSSANWAPTADGSEYPMDPHNTCEMAVTLDGKWVWITPNEEVPVSVTITSPDLRKYDSFFHRSRQWAWNVVRGSLLDLLVQFLQNVLHLDVGVGGSPDFAKVRVELNHISGVVVVRERTCVEVRQQTAHAQNQVRALHGFLNVRIGQNTNINSSVSWIILVERRLAHRSRENRELRGFGKHSHQMLDVVSGGTSVHQNDRVFGFLDLGIDVLHNLEFGLLLVQWQLEIELLLQPTGVNQLIHKV